MDGGTSNGLNDIESNELMKVNKFVEFDKNSTWDRFDEILNKLVEIITEEEYDGEVSNHFSKILNFSFEHVSSSVYQVNI